MTHTDTLRRALRAYDLAGPETPARAEALAAVLSAAHGVCAQPDGTICPACNGSGEPIDINEGYMFCMCGGTGRINPEPEQPLTDKECAAVQLQEGVTGCDIDCGCPYQKARDAKPAVEGWPGSPAPELPTPLQIEVANLRRQLRDTQDELQRARYSPAEHWT